MAFFVTREQFDAWAKNNKGEPGVSEIPALRKFGSFEIEKSETDPVTGMVDIDFVISTAAIDRDHDVIDQSGWQLENYMANPVVLWAHDYSMLPVGRSEKVWVKGKKLLSRDRFTPQEVNPHGHMVYQLIRGGFLRATSVGFRPTKYVYNEDHRGYDFGEQDLLEHSIVPVPANPEALVAASASGIDLTPMKEWAEKILDRDPDGDKVALWLPKELVANMHKELSSVAVSFNSTSTIDNADKFSIKTNGDSLDPEWQTMTTTGTARTNTNNDDREEILMEEAIKALTEVVRELNAAVDKLPDAIAEKVSASVSEKLAALNPPEKDADDDEVDISAEDFKALVTDAVNDALISTTGQLPD